MDLIKNIPPNFESMKTFVSPFGQFFDFGYNLSFCVCEYFLNKRTVSLLIFCGGFSPFFRNILKKNVLL
jgi:hypothetical protein